MHTSTIIKEGKRCWNEKAISVIQHFLDDYEYATGSRRNEYWRLHSFLGHALTKEVGFEWSSHKKDIRGTWLLKTPTWTASVQIMYDPIGSIELRPLRDIFWLWTLLRESFYE